MASMNDKVAADRPPPEPWHMRLEAAGRIGWWLIVYVVGVYGLYALFGVN